MSSALRRRLSITAVFSVVAVFAGRLSPMTALGAGNSGPAPIDGLVSKATGRTSALVHVAQGSSFDQGLAAARATGLDIGTHYEVIKVFVAYGEGAQFDLLTRDSAIEYIEANRRLELFTETSHKATRGQNLLDGEIKMPDGSAIDGRGVGVAVVDSGIDGTHPDLVDRMGGNVKILCSAPQFVASGALGGFQECRGPKEAVAMDDTDHPSAGGHGTHVAGTVAGTGVASNGRFHGAAPGATLYGVSVGTVIAVENGLDGLAWVLENHDQVAPAIKVVNNSWGSGYRKYSAEGDVLYSATWKLQDALIKAGVTVVFAAGNNGGNGSTPTTFAECINPTPGLVCVANYDDRNTGTRSGSISSSSSRGKTNEPVNWPDISAPGTSIVATCRITLPVCHAGGGMVSNPANLYATMSGTSMAAPHVSGIIAQLLQVDPTLTPAEVENILEDTAHKFEWGSAYGLFTDPFNPDNTSSFEKGHGLVDALAAVQSVLGGGTTDPEPTPTDTGTPTPTPTPEPTDTGAPTEPGTGKSYYFHSPTGLGNADWPAFGNPFDDQAPTAEGYSEWHDFPVQTNNPTSGQGPYDPNWVGTVDSKITSLKLDFWAKTPVGDLLGEVNYNPAITVGGVQYKLPTLTQAIDPQIGDVPTRLTKTYTTMLDAAGQEVPLNIDPQGAELTFTIAGRYYDEEAGSWIVYDSVEYPSGFTINGGGSGGTDPDPTPTETPTDEPTEPTPTARGTYPSNPNDPLFADQWGMTTIKAPEAWQETQATGYGVKIAIVDSGTDLGHEDFACPGKLEILPGSDVADGDSNPQDEDGHGTHTSGIAGACTDNGKGVVGVAPDSTIMPVRTIGGDGDLDKAMADGIRFATDNGAHVINLSIGDIPPFSHMGAAGYPLTEEAMEYARSAGVVIAAAAGNFVQPTCEYPSLSRNVICVVATDRNDMRAYYTDFPVNADPNGSGPSAERPFEPVVAAPGGQGTFCDEGIVSTYLRSEASTCYTKGYDSLDGTSMSAPHVAGLAAILYDRLGGQRSAANADLIVNTILETSDDLYTPGWDPIVGYGRINALAAVTSLPEPKPTETPTETPTEPQSSDTQVAFTDNTSGSVQYTDNGTLEAQLKDSSTGLPIEGAELVFELVGEAGSREFRATTDATGTASETFTAVEEPGAYTLNVRYAGKEGSYNGSADTRPFVVEKEDSSTALRVEGRAANKALTATLTESDAETPLEGRLVEFFVNGTSLGTATTDAEGTASLQVPRREAARQQDYEAVFTQDDFYLGSSGTARG